MFEDNCKDLKQTPLDRVEIYFKMFSLSISTFCLDLFSYVCLLTFDLLVLAVFCPTFFARMFFVLSAF